MDITYLGHASFRIKGKNAAIVTDPYDSQKVGFKFPSGIEADIVTISHQHTDHNFADAVKNYSKVIAGPGEYEIAGVSIIGFPSFHDDKKGEERGKNTVFVFEIDDMRIAHLGDLGHELSSDTLEEMGSIDILMIPVGGKYTIDSQGAVKVMQSIEPSIILPMHYFVPELQLSQELEKPEEFINASGIPFETMDKLIIKKSDIGEDQKIILLEKK